MSLYRRWAGSRIPALITCLVAPLFFSVPHANAVQSHGGAEGLVSHQLGHFLFVFAMAVLLLRLKKSRLTSPGWYEFKWFLWLIILWNLLTFTGHWMRETVMADCFVREDNQIISFQTHNFPDMLFYLTRLDHLLLVPAFLLLLFAIQKWGRN